MVRRAGCFLLIIILVFNPLEGVFARSITQIDTGHEFPAQCVNHVADSYAQSEVEGKNPLLIAGKSGSAPLISGLFPFSSHKTCHEKSCTGCAACAQGFIALLMQWLPGLPVFSSSLKSVYLTTNYRIDLQPALRPPRLS